MSNSSLRESLDSKNYLIIRNKLISLRNENHLTQRGLAKKLLVTQSYVSKVESGQRRLDILELNKYLVALNYSTNKLLLEIDVS